MKLIHTIPVVLGLFLATACGKKAGEEFVGELGKLKDEMCACKDKDCAEKVKEKERALQKKAQEKYKSEKDIDKGVMEKLDKLDDEMDACYDKLTEGQ